MKPYCFRTAIVEAALRTGKACKESEDHPRAPGRLHADLLKEIASEVRYKERRVEIVILCVCLCVCVSLSVCVCVCFTSLVA
jgi:hypothetical protein